MALSTELRHELKPQVVACLRTEPEIRRIVLFGFRIDKRLPTPQRAREVSEWAPLGCILEELCRRLADRDAGTACDE